MIDEVGGQRHDAARSEPVLPAIVEGVAGSSGREFFRRLAEQLSSAFDACAVRVSEIAAEGGRASVLGSYSRLDHAIDADFMLEGAAAERVALGDVVVHEHHARRAFPDDPSLGRMFVEAYVGVPMVDAQDDVIGLIEIFANGPIRNTHQATYVSRAMAGRAVAEIERDQAEAALRDSEVRYRALIEDSFHLVAEVVEERYVYVSAGYTEALGHEPEDLLGGSMFDLVHPEDKALVAAALKPIAASHESAHYTARLRHLDDSWRWIESTARAFRTSGGDYRTTIFSRDITQRLEAERELRDSEERFRLLAEHSTDIIGRYTTDLICTWISPSIRTIAGWDPEEIVGTRVRERIHPDDQVPPEARPSLVPKPGVPRVDLIRYRHKEGHYIWLETHTTAVTDPRTGELLEIHNRARDVTARKLAEDQLRESEAQFRLLAENSTDMIGRYALDGTCLWVSPSARGITGYTPQELQASHPEGKFHPDDIEEAWEAFRAMAEGGAPRTSTFRFLHKDGHYIWLEAKGEAVRDASGTVTEIQSSTRDVTARKLAEDQLRQSEEQFRLLAEHASDVIVRYDAAGTCLWISPSVKAAAGYEPEELIGIEPRFLVHPDDLPLALANRERVLTSEEPVRTTFRWPHKDGHYIWVESSASAIRDPQTREVVEIQLSARDITARKEAEDRLRANEELLRATLEASGDGVLVTRVGEQVLYVNARLADMFEIDAQALRQMDVSQLQALLTARIESPGRLTQNITSLPERGGLELGLVRSTTGRTFEVSATTIPQPEGAPHRVFSVHEVTELVNASDAICRSEERYRSLSESSPLGVFETDDMAQCTYVNQRGLEIAGITFEQASGWGWGSYIHPDDLEAVQEAWNASSDPGGEFSMEYRMRVPAGPIWVRVRAMLMRDEDGKPSRYVGTIEDVTEHRQAQDALRASEARTKALLEAIPDMMFVLDRSGRFLDCRIPDGSAFAGFRDRVVGMTIEELLGAKAAVTSREHLKQVFASGQMEQFEHEISVNGTKRYLETRYSRSGEEHAVAIVRDVTESRLLVDALRESEETARALLNAPTDGAVLIRRDGTILALNQTAQRRFKEHAATQPIAFDDFIGACVYDLFPEALREERKARNDQVFADGHRRHYEDERDGVWTDVTIDPIFDEAGNITRLAIFSRDITDRKHDEEALLRRSQELEALNSFLERTSAELERSQVELHEKTEQLAVLLDAEQARSKTDPLTAALNHGAISDVMKETIAADVAFAVAMVDIDGMKAVNDTYGHQTGDAVLLEAVRALNRGGAIVGRYGGDEFMVALLDADRAEADAYKASVDAALRDAHVIDVETGATVPVVASVGIAWYPDDAATLPTLIELADDRMYEEKAQRRTSTGLSSSRMFADDRTARMIGELVALFTGPGTLEEHFRLAAHRITLGGGYAAASFAVIDDNENVPVSSMGAFGRTSDELLEAWSQESRRPTDRPVSEIVSVTRKPFVINDIEASENVTEEQKAVLRAVGIGSGIVVPLFANEVLFATMSVGKKELGGFTEADERFLGDVGSQIAGIIDLARRAELQGPAAGPATASSAELDQSAA